MNRSRLAVLGLLGLLLIFGALNGNLLVCLAVVALALVSVVLKKQRAYPVVPILFLVAIPPLLTVGAQRWLDRDYAALFYSAVCYVLIQLYDARDEAR